MNNTTNATNSTAVTNIIEVDYASAVYAAIFIAYCIGLVAYLNFVVSNDTIFGLAMKLRKRQSTLEAMRNWTIIELVVIAAIPIAIGVVWSVHLTGKTDFKIVHVLAVWLLILFISSAIIGFTHWRANKWRMKTGIMCLFGFALFIAWAFGFSISCLGKTYSFTGYTAMLFTLNFVPVCFIIYQKTIWQDRSIQLLFEDVATKIA